jgi:hypothetical protein
MVSKINWTPLINYIICIRSPIPIIVIKPYFMENGELFPWVTLRLCQQPENTASSGRITHGRWTGRDLEGSGRNLIIVLSWRFPGDTEKIHEKTQNVRLIMTASSWKRNRFLRCRPLFVDEYRTKMKSVWPIKSASRRLTLVWLRA